MGKRVILVLALLATLVLTSCSCVEWWGHNIQGKYLAVRRDLHSMHRTWDYHFMNYDWEDPYID